MTRVRVLVTISAAVSAASQVTVCTRTSSRGSGWAGSRVVSRACQELARSATTDGATAW